jgi:hypothetical protein
MIKFTKDHISIAFINALAIKDIQNIVRRTQADLSEGETISFGVILERLIDPIIEILDSLNFGDPEDFKDVWYINESGKEEQDETLKKEDTK